MRPGTASSPIPDQHASVGSLGSVLRSASVVGLTNLVRVSLRSLPRACPGSSPQAHLAHVGAAFAVRSHPHLHARCAPDMFDPPRGMSARRTPLVVRWA